MTSQTNVSLDVAIMGREFRVACPDEERESLLQAVTYLDRKMREIRDHGKVIGLERIAIMAALNITHDYLAAKPINPDDHLHRAQVGRLIELLDQALAPQDNLF
ncbi:MAG: cell division protein ZapA [Pseudomonadota bacterium]|nr:cell division protein ZapA [Pseudomonadota bacterium]MDP1906069.1 cell division protein ZapA [Pseudomonadota bacterium]MDP2353145.1 cell division protein ZapA [Pseudomonadota bacterium]